ncbi:MAG TPA: hypothetical protein VE076_06440 [Nitrososphaeraceae archaeon]|nr:hypothetical protein [Nitrososphaeraceae archaeon]
MPRFGIATSYLHIKASKNDTVGPNTLQIVGNVSFPVQYVNSGEKSHLLEQYLKAS